MSEIKRFLKVISSDETMKTEVSALKGLTAIAAYAAGKNFKITENDLRDAVSHGKDLSEEDLEKIAAGSFWDTLGDAAKGVAGALL